MKSILGFLLVGLLATSSLLQAETIPSVATSIKPVSMVVKAIAGDKVNIEQIVSNNASPHDFALRPSDLRKVINADLVVWVGESLEPFLEKPLHNSQHADTAIEWLSLVESAGDHHKSDVPKTVKSFESHGHGHGHHHDGLDPHVWLDLENAHLLADAVTEKLSIMLPQQASYFEQNLADFEAALAKADAENKQMLSPLKTLNYVVFHDAYSYFEAHYDIAHIANISLSPERKPGAKKVVSIRRLMKDEQVACIFSEVQFNPAIVNVLVEGTNVKAIELDPLGANIALNEAAYVAFIKQLGHQFSECQA